MNLQLEFFVMQVSSAIFVSDFHIGEKNSKRYYKTLEFLKNIAAQFEYIFFLGDIFEFWYNDRPALINEYSDFLELLQKISASGTRLYFFEGNHDICYGNHIRQKLKAEVFRKSTIIKINDFNVLIGHGDDLVKNNPKYRFLRAFLRLEIVKFILSVAPSKPILKLAIYFSKLSRSAGKIQKYNINEELKKIALDKFKNGIDIMITGHSHIPDASNLGKGQYFNCGNWIEDFTYIQYKNNVFTLEKISEN